MTYPLKEMKKAKGKEWNAHWEEWKMRTGGNEKHPKGNEEYRGEGMKNVEGRNEKG